MAKAFIDKYHLEMVAGILGKFGFSGLGEIAEDVSKPENAIQFHGELSGMMAMIINRLEEDHSVRHIEGCSCGNFKSFIATEDRQESTKSISGGDDGQREIYSDASTDGQLQGSVFNSEVAGEDSNSRHEAQVHGGDGVERTIDDGDW